MRSQYLEDIEDEEIAIQCSRSRSSLVDLVQIPEQDGMENIETVEEPWFKEGLRFKCTGCGKCCTGSPGYVFLGSSDQRRLENHLSLDAETFTARYTQQVDDRLSLIDHPNSTGCI